MEVSSVQCLKQSKILLLSFTLCLFSTIPAQAADENDSKVLDEIIIEAPKAEIRDIFEDFMPVPTAKFKVERENIDTINTATIEDTLRYAPNIEVRRRFIGDINSPIAMRGNGQFQTARHMVFVDGFPLHSFLETRFNGAPQWNLVAPDETESVNVTYGPFSPKHSGNAMGGVVDIFTREPQGEEWGLQTTGWVQDWEVGKSKGVAPGYKTFFSYANKVDKFSYYMFYNRLETESQPQTIRFDTSTSAGGSGTAVTGAFSFIDTRERGSVAFSDDGEEKVVNDLVKFKANYEISPQLKLRGMLGYLIRDRKQLNVNNLLRDSSNNKVFSGSLNFDGIEFNVSESNFKVSSQENQDLISGLGASGKFGNGWNYDAVLSANFIIQDDDRDSDENPESAAFDKSGTLTEFHNSGWQLFEVRADKEAFLGNPNLSFETGYHYDHARIETRTYAIPDWELSNRDKGTFSKSSGGQTDAHALHANLGWEFQPKWDLQVGGRAEAWRSFNGFLHETVGEIGGQAPRAEQALSPKISLGFKPDQKWDFRFSLARSTRFPMPEELFKNIDTFDDKSVANPGLEPEVGSHATFIVGHFLPKATTQLTVFYDDITNAIFNDTDTANGITSSTFLNIDKTRTVGVELVLRRQDYLVPKHDLNFNIAYIDSEILRNNGNPSTVGNNLPRVPHLRTKLQSVYHFRDNWDAMAAVRWQTNMFGRLQNDDILSGPGSTMPYVFVDLKSTYKHKNLNASLGINNINNYEAFIGPHKYPGRTFLVDLKWKFM
jgi:iron complex outermembrane recepter protein